MEFKVQVVRKWEAVIQENSLVIKLRPLPAAAALALCFWNHLSWFKKKKKCLKKMLWIRGDRRAKQSEVGVVDGGRGAWCPSFPWSWRQPARHHARLRRGRARPSCGQECSHLPPPPLHPVFAHISLYSSPRAPPTLPLISPSHTHTHTAVFSFSFFLLSFPGVN